MDTGISINRKFERMLANILSIFAILAIAFPAMGSVSAQETIPWLIAFPENDAVEGWEWPAGATVTLTIDNAPSLSWGGTAKVTTWGDPRTHVRFEFWEDYDLQVGDVVTLTDEFGTMATHTVQNLSVTEVNAEADTVSGSAYIGAVVQVWPHEYDQEYFIEETAEDGSWFADFGALGFLTIEETGGRSQIVVDGNATAVDWYVPNPHFTVFPEWEFFDGLEWPDGANVIITVEEKPECETTKESWGGFFNGNFGQGCDVVFGDTVTFTDGETVRTHTVQNLSITKVDPADDIVKGVADAGAEVYVWPHATGQEPLAITNPKGRWNIDFTGIYDLAPGDGGRAEIRDEMGNATAVDWNVSNPRLIAFPAVDQIFVYYWPEGSRVNLTINGKHIAGETVQGAPWDPNDIMAFFDFGDLHDLVVGDLVTLSGHDMEINYTVQSLTVTEVNEMANTVTGTADPGVEVMVYPFDYGDQPLQVTADENGDWFANFEEAGIDLVSGMCGRSDIFDEFTNSTTVDWCIPNPEIRAWLGNQRLEGYQWPLGEWISLFINGTDFEPQQVQGDESWTYVSFDLGEWILEPGQEVVMAGAGIEKTHVILPVSITLVDTALNLVEGTSTSEGRIILCVYDGGCEPPTEVFADTSGNWSVDYGEDFDILPGFGMDATEFDGDGDGTSFDYWIPEAD